MSDGTPVSTDVSTERRPAKRRRSAPPSTAPALPTALRTVRRVATWSALLAGIALAPSAVASTSLAGLDRAVAIKAREQPVGKFLRELFGQMGVPVAVDPAVQGAVNGDFAKPASEVLEEVQKAFQLTFYYDGAVAHVYPVAELARDILYMPRRDSRAVVEHAATLNLTDASNRLESAELGLVATGTPRFLEQVRELSDAVSRRAQSAENSPETFRVFKLRYGWADDTSIVVGGQKVVVPGVASLLARLVGAEGIGGEAGGASLERTPLSPMQPKLRGQGLRSIGAEGSETIIPGQAIEEGDAVASLAITTLPGSGSGRARIVADPLNNAIVIRDRADRMANYERLIDTLDVEPLMVEIEATIIDMNTGRLRELGVDWRLQSGRSDSLVGAAAPGGAATPIGEGGLVSLMLGDRTKFISRIRALETQGAARIVSKPHVITIANVEALLDSTSTFFVRLGTTEEVDLVKVTAGTTMRVTPHVLESRGRSRTRLLISIEDGVATGEFLDRIPVIDSSSINTRAMVEEGQSLLIGGLIRQTRESRVSKVPLLGDLPGIGALFRSNSDSNSQTERLFLITPRLTKRFTDSGLRLDAPILAGSEGDIVRSAPIRLEAVQTALAERDALAPVAPPLPAPGADVRLDAVTSAEPGTTTAFAPRRPAPLRLERAPAPSAPSVPAPAGGGDGRAIRVSAPRAVPAAGVVEPGESGWEEVPGSRPAG